MRKNSLANTHTPAIIIATVLLLFALVSCSESEIPSGYKLASNDIVDYTLVVPEDWVISSSTGAVSAYVSGSNPSSVSVMAWNLENTSATPDEWWQNYRTDFDLVFTDFETIEETDTVLDGITARKYVYTAKLGEVQYKFMQVVAMRKSMVYLFTYTAITENYDTVIEDVDSILGYFKFN